MKNIDQSFLSGTQTNEYKLSHEKLKNAEFIEISKKIGEVYLQFVSSLAGRGKFDIKNLDDLPKDFSMTTRHYIEIATKSIQEIKEDTLRRGIKSEDIVGQLCKEPEAGKELLESGGCVFEEPTEGIYIYHLNAEDFHQIKNYSKAFFSSGHKIGIPFIVSPLYVEEKYKNYAEKEQKENIPHEINHLVWYCLKKKGALKCSETDDEIKKAFLMFQEELMSKLVSNGGLMAYSHLSLMSQKKHDEYEKNNPEKMKEIYSIVGPLNNLLWEQMEPLFYKQTTFKKSDLFYAVSEAKNFVELRKIMEKWLGILKIEAEKSV